MAKKQQPKRLEDMTEAERMAELERLRAEAAVRDARRQRLQDTGFYDWSEDNNADNHGDTWLAAYDKAIEDMKANAAK
jgi:hypothetical protein